MNPTIAGALQPFVDRHSLAGAVTLVATKDKIVDVTAVGFADIAAQKPMQPDSLFWIASMTKPMTTTALLLLLVDEGKLSVDDPVEKYLPEFEAQMVVAEKAEDRAVRMRACRRAGDEYDDRLEAGVGDDLPRPARGLPGGRKSGQPSVLSDGGAMFVGCGPRRAYSHTKSLSTGAFTI
ncbi:MAG: serine hydrolase domain-containing protein [Verrucomicrobiota bacterium]